MPEDYNSPSQTTQPQQPHNSHSPDAASSPENQLANRWVLMAAGGALGLLALTRRSKTSTAVAAVGLFALTEAGMWSKQQGGAARSRAHHQTHASFAIQRSPEEAYNFWHDLENLPRFMQYLESVKKTDNNRSEWTAIGPLHTKFQWSSQITEDRPNERIAWRSIEGSEIHTHGSVEFRPGPNGRGTIVRARISYMPPAGALGHSFASLLGKDPGFTVREDLRRFKALIETGEVPTTVGQPHGPRGVSGYAKAALLREHNNMPQPQAEMRRAG